MQIFLCNSWKWRAFATPFHDPILKDRIKCMFTFVWKYINLSDALRVKCYTNITHTSICTSAFKIWFRTFILSLFRFVYYLTWQLTRLENFHSLQFTGGSVNAAVVAQGARETGSRSRIVSTDLFFFFTGQIFKNAKLFCQCGGTNHWVQLRWFLFLFLIV